MNDSLKKIRFDYIDQFRGILILITSLSILKGLLLLLRLKAKH